jgi:hypothetical protein
MFENLALVQIIDNCTRASIIAVIRSLLAKIQIFELFDWLKFFEGNSHCLMLRFVLLILSLFNVALCFAGFSHRLM